METCRPSTIETARHRDLCWGTWRGKALSSNFAHQPCHGMGKIPDRDASREHINLVTAWGRFPTAMLHASTSTLLRHGEIETARHRDLCLGIWRGNALASEEGGRITSTSASESSLTALVLPLRCPLEPKPLFAFRRLRSRVEEMSAPGICHSLPPPSPVWTTSSHCHHRDPSRPHFPAADAITHLRYILSLPPLLLDLAQLDRISSKRQEIPVRLQAGYLALDLALSVVSVLQVSWYLGLRSTTPKATPKRHHFVLLLSRS
jgi:hypothetical protein